MSNWNGLFKVLLVSLICCAPSLLAAQDYKLWKQTGTLYGLAFDCGEPLEEIYPYFYYSVLIQSGALTAKSKAESDRMFNECLSVIQASFKSAIEAPPRSDCDAVFRLLDKIKRAHHNFYDTLTPSMRKKLKLRPLPPMD